LNELKDSPLWGGAGNADIGCSPFAYVCHYHQKGFMKLTITYPMTKKKLKHVLKLCADTLRQSGYKVEPDYTRGTMFIRETDGENRL
jgi:hypothetical protein